MRWLMLTLIALSAGGCVGAAFAPIAPLDPTKTDCAANAIQTILSMQQDELFVGRWRIDVDFPAGEAWETNKLVTIALSAYNGNPGGGGEFLVHCVSGDIIAKEEYR